MLLSPSASQSNPPIYPNPRRGHVWKPTVEFEKGAPGVVGREYLKKDFHFQPIWGKITPSPIVLSHETQGASRLLDHTCLRNIWIESGCLWNFCRSPSRSKSLVPSRKKHENGSQKKHSPSPSRSRSKSVSR